jgi:predicted alpha-1,2-mannosidase
LNNIIDKDLQEEYLPSLVRTQDLLGWWPNGHVMIGNHAISVLCDAWAKGIRCFDPEDVLGRYVSEITKSQLERDVNAAYNAEHLRGFGRMGFEDYFSIGYIPFPQGTNRVMETTSKTLEYNYDDFCAWKLARMAGLDFYKNVFARHIFNYRNVYDPSDGFFKGRDREGKFDEDFNPYEWGGPFVEGNGWQWRFFVPQDAAGMMSLMGGKDGFVKNLDALFAAPSDSALCGGYGFMIHEIYEAMAGKQGQYAQGNEPCFHVMHLYNYAGKPWKAQEWLRDSMERLFDSSEKGFPGDEDGGAMSAWYVFNAMGFYPVTPGVAQYSIGSPLFDKVTVSLPDGGTFTIKAEGNGPGNVYIESATLDGKEYVHNYLDHSAVVSGGTLVLKMSPKPNLTRGTSPEDAPYSMSTDK